MMNMKVFRAVVFFLSLTLFLNVNTPISLADPISPANIGQFLDQQFIHKMEQYNIPNATVSVVADGKVVFQRGYGFASLEEQRSVDPETSLFRIGSVSKLFTWTAVMQLVEQGKLDLMADINSYLDFEIPAKIVGMKTNGAAAPITLTHLMTHTPGFEDYSGSIFRLELVDVLPLARYVRNYLPARVFPSGEVIAYSNYGTALAGYIVERVSGMPFHEYVEQYIFTPLGMNNSTFLQPLPDEFIPNMTQAYRYVHGQYQKGAFEFVPESAGGMSSTATDMARFMLAYLQDGLGEFGQILATDTVELMRNQLFSHHSSLQGIAYGFMEGIFNGQRTLFHSGSTMLFDTGFYLLPEENVGLFISLSGGNYLVHKEIFEAFLVEYYPSNRMNGHSSPPSGTKERSSKYIGEYHQNRKSFTTSDKISSLMMGMIHVKWDDEGYLLVNHVGDTYRFVEVERGVYQRLDDVKSKDPFGDMSTIVFSEDPLGNMVLLTDGPMSYSKAPWYGTSSFTFFILIVSLLFIIGSFIYRVVIMGIVRLMKRKGFIQPTMATAARWTVVVYSLLALGFVLGIALSGEIDPVYGLPKSTYDIPSWHSVFDVLPVFMVIVTIALLIFTVLAWWKKYWKLISRIHYTLFTFVTIALCWLFSYWNIV